MAGSKFQVDVQAARARLEQLRAAHLERIDADALAERESPDVAGGPRVTYDAGDLSTHEIAESDRLADAERATHELRQIEDALQRLENGTYGQCIECGEVISPQRLEVVPTAERCIECQSAYDREHVTGAHHATL